MKLMKGKYLLCSIVIAALLLTSISASISTMQQPPASSPQRAVTSWTNTTVASIGDVGQYCSMALNPQMGFPTIAFYNATSKDLGIASWQGDHWDLFTPFPTPNDDGLYCSITMNETGGGGSMAHVSCYDATNGDLIYANQLGWNVVDSANDVGQHSCIATQGLTNSIAISYYDNTTGDLKVAYNKTGNTSWAIYTVDSAGDTGQYTNLKFYPNNDSMSITYYNVTGGDLMNAWIWDIGPDPQHPILDTWYTMPIDTVGDTGKWSSQAMKEDDSWYGSWYVPETGDLRTAYWDSQTGNYTQTDIDTANDVGLYSSIAINSVNNTFISYYDATNGDLKVAWKVSAYWNNTAVDWIGDVGKFTSMQVGSNNSLHIAYYDVTNGDLKYFYEPGHVNETSPTEQIAILQPPYGDFGQDMNGNGKYDFLIVGVGVNVTTPGMYGVQGALCNLIWSPIVNASYYLHLNASLQMVPLMFSGINIHEHGYDGPYNVSIVLRNATFGMIDSDNFTTGPYNYTMFEHPSATLSPPFSDHGEDVDADGQYNYLVISVMVNVSTYDTYGVEATLFDGMSSYVSSCANWTNLSEGMQMVEVRFDGGDIFDHGYDGAYNVSLDLRDDMGMYIDHDEYTTGSYMHTEFEQPAAVFQQPYNDFGEDLDADGLYDNLVVSVQVNVSVAGFYRIEGVLLDDMWSFICNEWNNTNLTEGVHIIELRFSGLILSIYGYDGAYNVSLNLRDEWFNMLNGDTYTTNPYLSSEFEQTSALTPPYGDHGEDTNANGQYEYLVISVPVNVTSAGWYRLEGALYSTFFIESMQNFTELAEGLQMVDLRFSGWKIFKYGSDGQFAIDLDLYQGVMRIDNDTYMTGSYLRIDFEPPAAIFSPPFSDHGEDMFFNGLYDYLVFSAPVNVSVAGWYRVEGSLIADFTCVQSLDNYSYLGMGLSTVDLRFDGWRLFDQGYDGTYLVNLYLLDDSWELLDAADNITTGAYVHTDFDPPSHIESAGDYVEDRNGNGLYDNLVVCILVNGTAAGWYSVEGDLYDGVGGYVNSANNYTSLSAGLQTAELRFNGAMLYGYGYNGTYHLNLSLRDASGDLLSEGTLTTASYHYDAFDQPPSAPPIITITGPTSDPSMSTNWHMIYLEGNASDDVGVTSVTWVNDAGGSGTANGTAIWNSKGNIELSEGMNVITVTAHDASGNSATDTLVVTYDAAAPTCFITSPTSAPTCSTSSAFIDLSGTANDDVEVANVTWMNLATGESGMASGLNFWSVFSISLSAGLNQIYVNATDGGGNSGSDAIFVTYDPNIPSVTIINPTAGPTMATGWHYIWLNGTASDNTKVISVTWTNSLGGSGNAYMVPQWGAANVAWQSRGNVLLYSGDNVIDVTAWDNAGNSATATITVTYDQTVPACTIESPTTNLNYYTNAATVDLSGSASDAIGVATVTWKNVATGDSGTCGGTDSWSATGIPLTVGVNLIYVNATDNAGNRGCDRIFVTYDLDSLSVTIINPTSNPTLTTGWHYVWLNGTASDDNKVTLITWSNALTGDSGTAYMTPQWGGPSVTWQSRGNVHLLPGDNVITVTAYDVSGNSVTDVVTITYTGL